ncbi:conserved hypothetical protein [Culex quinquefasciatus]|uniref:Uncharacterized protein n=1 Tax=Culex quinquefasciatus TaxID=7176 RepID=B0WD19_CULQU|nr:conserved hypothetical protein [Culex quinquefasciatus]|eukprot:XP_001846603.1 conserved hypothetical protein [Culex quinquefasciatus]
MTEKSKSLESGFDPPSFGLPVEFRLERVEHIGDGYVDCRLRVRKFNRTTYTLNGTATLLMDLDDSYEVAVKFAYSSLGNNQFNEYPMKIPQKNVCRYLVEEYAEYQHMWVGNTNLPKIPKGTTEYCPLAKGEYWIKDLAPDATSIPPVVPAGLWRMTMEFWKQNSLDFQILVYCQIQKSLFII